MKHGPFLMLLMAVAGLGVACGSPDEAPAKETAQEVTEAEARALYIRKCSLCHGDEGKLMASKSPDLSQSNLSLAERVALVTYGKGTMPGQKGTLNRSEIRAVAQYIERFRE